MQTLEEFYEREPIERLIDQDSGLGAQEMLKAGIPIFYRDEKYPETMDGDLFVKEYSSGAKFIVRRQLTSDFRVLEEQVKSLNDI